MATKRMTLKTKDCNSIYKHDKIFSSIANMQKLLFLFFVFILTVVKATFAQFYLVGQDPASVQWNQIKTPHYRIIYPKGYYNNAKLYANTLEISHSATLSPFLTQTKKPFSIVLHTHSTWANAMVLPAPLHGDFFEIPDQNQYAQIWQYQLSLHETRHFVQMRKMYQGVGKALYYLFGQGGPTALFGIFVPMWFIEGDAVYNETIHSKSGRGRLPAFSMDLKAQVLDKEIYKFDKAVLGSYRNYVPDHYTLGYQLVLYGAEHYTYNMWNLAMERVARRPYLLKPFVNGLKTFSGLQKVKYYHKVLDTLQIQWATKLQKQKIIEPQQITTSKKHKFFSSYRFPVLLSDGSYIAERSSIDDINRFVKITPTGKEKIIFTPGFDYAQSLSANDSLICWNEKQYDLRWSNQDYSIIKIYNYKTKQLRVLTKKSKMFAPVLSPDASKIVAVSVSETGINSLQILDATSGKVLTTFSTADNLFFMTPNWSDDGELIVVTVLGKQGKSILLFNPKTKSHQLILPFGYSEINRPALKGNILYYTATYDGINNIYSYNLKSKEIKQITFAKYGVENGSVSKNNKLVFSNYTADGYRIATLDLDTVQPEITTSVRPFVYPIDKQVTASTFVLEDATITDKQYEEKKYSRAEHLFNPHTWGPLLVDVNTFETVPNLVIASQNLLSTSVSTLGYYYNINEETGKTKFTFNYYGWYPAVGLQASFGGRKQWIPDDKGINHLITWSETNINLNISVPLKFIKSKWISGITPRVTAGQKFIHFTGTYKDEPDIQLTSLGYSVSAFHRLKKSGIDLLSKWSQSVFAAFNHTPFATDVSNLAYLSGTFTFPGIIKHHGFKLYIGQQWKHNGSYSYGDYIPVPRGYSGLQFSNMTSLKVDYAFPIVYPDWDLQSAAYLTRIYAHLFYDYSQFTKPDDSAQGNVYSTGAELYTNWHFLSLPVEFTLGIRESYKANGVFATEFLFGFGL